MSQKMRMLLALFITLPLILSIELHPGFAESINIPDYDPEQAKRVEDFISKTEEEKDKILKELDSSISNLNGEIKKYT